MIIIGARCGLFPEHNRRSAFTFADLCAKRCPLAIGPPKTAGIGSRFGRSEEHTSELQSLMRISYAVFCLKKKKKKNKTTNEITTHHIDTIILTKKINNQYIKV